MIDYSKLRGRIKEKFDTLGAFANALGIDRVSLSQRLNHHLCFSQMEMLRASELLEFPVEEIPEFFFKILK